MNKDKLKQYELLYFQNDEPIPYKLKCGYELLIKPIKVKDWSIFENSIDILKIDKNSINNIDIIQMSYLEFLKKIVIEDKSEIQSQKLANIFYYSMLEEHLCFSVNKNKCCICLLNADKTVKAIITQKEFDEISDIILFQNIKDYDDREVNSDVKELYEEYYRIKNKNSRTPTLEEQKTYVMAKCGYQIEKINNMSYRMFSQIYSHAVDDIIYIGQKIIQGSYKYSVEDDIIHPLYAQKKDKYEEIFTSTSTLAQKGIVGAEQLNNLN